MDWSFDSETDPKQFRHFQTVKFANLKNMENVSDKTGVGLLGYAVDKGVETIKVESDQGRVQIS